MISNTILIFFLEKCES